MKSLKQTLDSLYRDCNFNERIKHDPIQFPRKCKARQDIEVSGLIAASFAYGRVSLFIPVIKNMLLAMGASPYDFLMGFNPKRQGRLFQGMRYRFQGPGDIVAFLYIISMVLNKYGSIRSLFERFYDKGDPDTGRMLSGAIKDILEINTSSVYGKNIKPKGLKQLFPAPSEGSACKRINLFLRWMVRDKDIDFGIWKDIPKNRLIIPLDTHIMRVSKGLGLTNRKTGDWKTAVEITAALRKINPEDPLKYDFALCHRGMKAVAI